MKKNLIGIDIGGTKCAVIYGRMDGNSLEIVDKIKFPTAEAGPTLENIKRHTAELMSRCGLSSGNTDAIGVSCGGPLDSEKGIIKSPPNLKGWDDIPIVDILAETFGVRTALQNDANACALAEWKFGAGQGSRNMIFLTFGTGLGAGLIIDGRLFSGTNGNAGEVGHIRLSGFGPVGYGKSGSFEGFCSGGGIAQLARTRIDEQFQMGRKVSFCASRAEMASVTAQTVAEAAKAGDELAREIYEISGEYLGRGLSVLIDTLNPDTIVIGSIFARSGELLIPAMKRALEREALPVAYSVCRIVPALLGDAVGDYASLSVAADALGV